jgi:hypothetical protein
VNGGPERFQAASRDTGFVLQAWKGRRNGGRKGDIHRVGGMGGRWRGTRFIEEGWQQLPQQDE